MEKNPPCVYFVKETAQECKFDPTKECSDSDGWSPAQNPDPVKSFSFMELEDSWFFLPILI